jgi:hypothetical protein
MTIKSKVTGIGDKGELYIKLFGGDMTKIKLGQIVDIEIRQRQRSINQNNFYHLFVEYCLPFYQDFDPTMTHDELHLYFRYEILGYSKEINGNSKRFARSTTSLGVLEFCYFMENCFLKAMQDVDVSLGDFQEGYEKWKSEHPAGKAA